MARGSNSLDAMSYAELSQMQTRIERLKIEKQNAERNELRQRIVAMVKQHGFEISCSATIWMRTARQSG